MAYRVVGQKDNVPNSRATVHAAALISDCSALSKAPREAAGP